MATLSPLHLPFTSSLLLSKRRPCQAFITGMVINEDEMYNPNSMEISSELSSDDLWLSLSSFMDNKGQEASAASQSLMGLSSSLFNDVNSFVMDKEDPAEYVPAPAISAADAELNSHLETALYMLKEVLTGPMVEEGMDKKFLEAWSFVSDDIKVQGPLVCLEGKDRLWTWLHKLAITNAHIYLDEIYVERSRALSCKICFVARLLHGFLAAFKQKNHYF